MMPDQTLPTIPAQVVAAFCVVCGGIALDDSTSWTVRTSRPMRAKKFAGLIPAWGSVPSHSNDTKEERRKLGGPQPRQRLWWRSRYADQRTENDATVTRAQTARRAGESRSRDHRESPDLSTVPVPESCMARRNQRVGAKKQPQPKERSASAWSPERVHQVGRSSWLAASIRAQGSNPSRWSKGAHHLANAPLHKEPMRRLVPAEPLAKNLDATSGRDRIETVAQSGRAPAAVSEVAGSNPACLSVLKTDTAQTKGSSPCGAAVLSRAVRESGLLREGRA